MLWYHDHQGLPYIEATIQVDPRKCGLSAGATRDTALATAADRLGKSCCNEHREGRSATAIPLLQTALKEAMTTLSLPLEHDAVLYLNH